MPKIHKDSLAYTIHTDYTNLCSVTNNGHGVHIASKCLSRSMSMATSSCMTACMCHKNGRRHERSYVISDGHVALRMEQKLLDHLGVTFLTCKHKWCGAILEET